MIGWPLKGDMSLVKSKMGALFRLCVLAAILLPVMTFAAQPGQHTQAGKKPLPAPAQGLRESPSHILIKLDSHADVPGFLKHASKRGFHKFGRVYGSDWYTFSLPPQASPREAAQQARTLPGVVLSTMDPIVTLDVLPPRDPLYRDDDDPSTKSCDPLEEVCNPLDLVDQWGIFKVDAESAWSVTTGSNTVVIAVVDSGVDLDHDDLIGNIWTNPAETVNGIDDDGNGFIDDIHGADFVGDNGGDPYTDNVASQDADPDVPQGGSWVYDPFAYPYGIRFDGDPAVGDAVDNNFDGYPDLGVFHGTFVAGIIAAMTDNINPETGVFEGMAGACWNCKIMPVRMINAEGNGYGSDAAAAIYYAVDMGASIINLSWGFDLDNLDSAGRAEVAVITDAINHAVNNGVIVVASAGNSGGPALRFPASMANTIAVGSSNWLDHRSEFSTIANPGEIPDNGIDDDGNGRIDDVLDVLAPGEYIWSGYVYSAFESLQAQFLGDESVEPGTDAYGNSNGTSFSAPLVAGYVGLLTSRFPDATLNEIRQVIRSNAIDLPDPEGTGDNLPGYDAFSGFGRLRMVMPNSLSDPPSPPPSPLPPGPVIALMVDEIDTGQYGYHYGSNEHETVLATTFVGDGSTPYELHVTGYDIDDSTEVAVYLNGTRIGYLSVGPDNGLNAGDVFALDPALQVAGENSIEFRERVEGWTWGVSALGVLSPPPPPPEVTLALDVLDTGQYGQYYGSYQYGASVVATFVGDGSTPYELHVTGYDIDDSTEVAVYLNGTRIGYLSVGPDKGLNAGDVFVLDPALQVAGENSIEFRERVPGSRWGVTALGVLSPPPPPPDVTLALDVLDTGQYGQYYGSYQYGASVVATFVGDGSTPYELHVTGYDIDDSTEVAVYLNGTRIGYLSVGPDKGLNAGDVFVLDPALQVAGENSIEFRERVPGSRWGVTALGVLSPPPPPPEVTLALDVLDTGQYGQYYGSYQYGASVVATFVGDGATAYELHVTGYDIDDSTEVAVYLNGTRIGYLSVGPDKGLNAGDVFVLDPALQVAGENSIEFRERVPGSRWGVTALGVLSPPPPDVTLTLDVLDTGQYGQYYGSYQYGASVVAAFVGDGATPYELHVTGYDIDDSTEVAVYLNGTRIGYLSVGPNKKLNAGDVFVLDPALQDAGENRIEFRERVPGSRWGVTALGVLSPPPPDVTLTLDVLDTGQYGQYYGSYQYGASVVAAFVGDGATPYELHVTGHDIDDSTEVAVYLNGTRIGYLSVGPNKKLNAGDVFVLDPALLKAGENRIEFRERVPGSRWGVTNLGVFDLGTP